MKILHLQVLSVWEVKDLVKREAAALAAIHLTQVSGPLYHKSIHNIYFKEKNILH